MLYLVRLNGLPAAIRHREIRKFIKEDVRKHNITTWVRQMKSSPDLKKVLIEVYSEDDAKKLVGLFNGKTYVSNDNITYTCSAFVESTCEARLTVNPTRKHLQPNNGTSKEKQSEVTENKGSTDKFEDTALLPAPMKLPKFNHVIKKLVIELDDLIKKHCHSQTGLFLRALRMRIRERLTQVFEGKDLINVYSMPPPKVLKAYRKAHNKSTDEAFVVLTYKMVQEACWPCPDTMEDGIYLEELEVENGGIVNINGCDNSDKATVNNVPEGNKDSIKDEEEWSTASWSDGGNTGNT